VPRDLSCCGTLRTDRSGSSTLYDNRPHCTFFILPRVPRTVRTTVPCRGPYVPQYLPYLISPLAAARNIDTERAFSWFLLFPTHATASTSPTSLAHVACRQSSAWSHDWTKSYHCPCDYDHKRHDTYLWRSMPPVSAGLLDRNSERWSRKTELYSPIETIPGSCCKIEATSTAQYFGMCYCGGIGQLESA
jgi:hypothetical protein